LLINFPFAERKRKRKRKKKPVESEDVKERFCVRERRKVEGIDPFVILIEIEEKK